MGEELRGRRACEGDWARREQGSTRVEIEDSDPPLPPVEEAVAPIRGGGVLSGRLQPKQLVVVAEEVPGLQGGRPRQRREERGAETTVGGRRHSGGCAPCRVSAPERLPAPLGVRQPDAPAAQAQDGTQRPSFLQGPRRAVGKPKAALPQRWHQSHARGGGVKEGRSRGLLRGRPGEAEAGAAPVTVATPRPSAGRGGGRGGAAAAEGEPREGVALRRDDDHAQRGVHGGGASALGLHGGPEARRGQLFPVLSALPPEGARPARRPR